MRLLRLVWTLGAVCAGLLAQPAQAQNAPPPPPAPGQFSFRVCNNSGLTLYFVFIYLNSVTDARFRTTGTRSTPASVPTRPAIFSRESSIILRSELSRTTRHIS